MASKLTQKNTSVFVSPESSNVEGGTYDPKSRGAVIAFRNKKDPEAVTVFYSYCRVKAKDWEKLKSAVSKGRHMRETFCRLYKGEKI